MFRRLYTWVLSWADTPYGSVVLFVMAFAESSFFPIPPDVLQIALSVSKPFRAFWYAAVSLTGSVCGAMLGYYLGYVVWDTVSPFFFQYHIFSESVFNAVKDKYNQDAVFWVFIGGTITPIPYKVFTIAAGVCHMPLLLFFAGSLLGRSSRFFIVASLFYFFGPAIKIWIDKYLNIFAVVFLVLLIGGFIALKYLV
ncbi:hypothetical protein FACS1894170_07440 [Planctomycetales bacterium]|nr:hypothetical protein FACS1894170_07440 [Planctomycetales bacterium]